MTDPLTSSLTEQQRLAVTTHDVSVVLASGAGCGKTHVLTARYLSHLLEDQAEVGEIVAITFTERAARQMRGRIREVLTSRLKQAGTEPESEVWRRHLRGLESAPISTIHAFCGTLLRQHAIAAGLDAHFEVLEDVLAVNLETEALQSSLQRLLTSESEAGDDLRQLVLLYGWRPVVEGIPELLSQWDERHWLPWLQLSETEIVARWSEQSRRLLPGYIDSLLARRPAIVRCLSLLRRHPPLAGPMSDNVRFIQDQLPRLAASGCDSPENLTSLVEQLHEAAKVGRAGSKAWPDADVYEQIKKAFEDFRKELKGLELGRFASPPEGLEKTAQVGRRLVRVVRAVQQAYAERKRHAGVVDFQDLLVLARDLLLRQENVRARLQQHYRFVLLDEAQDTDPVQMELIQLLCGARRTEGKLFAVGDFNQSIYRFRGANVQLFEDLRQDMPHQGRLGLTVNFRSQPAILDFANALLGHRLADYQPLRAFHPQVNPGPCVEFLWAPRADKSSVTEGRLSEAEWIARRLAAMIGRETLVVDRESPSSPLAPLGRGVGGEGFGRLRLSKQQQDFPAKPQAAKTEEPLTPNPSPQRGEGTSFSQLRSVRAGDVVLLFRSMSNVPLYEDALRRWGLDYYLVGGRTFFAQQEIYDLLSLLRALENPQDSVSLAGVLRSPFCCLSDESLYLLGRHKEGLWAGLQDPESEGRLAADQKPAVRRAREHLQRWREQKDRLPIARLLGAVFADSGFDAATQLEFLPDRKLANLWKLMELARTFDRSGLFGLAEFIGRLGDLVKNQSHEEQAATQPENADVIRLMSIHQAKGLEFPVVVIPDLAAGGGGSARPIASWDALLGCVARPPRDEEEPPFADFAWELLQARNEVEEWREDLRILYVACTRARDYLILSSALSRPIVPNSPWMLTLAERFDLLTGECLVPDLPAEHRPRVLVVGQNADPDRPGRDHRIGILCHGVGQDSDLDPRLNLGQDSAPDNRPWQERNPDPQLPDGEAALKVFPPPTFSSDLVLVEVLCDWLQRRGTLHANLTLQTDSWLEPEETASLTVGWLTPVVAPEEELLRRVLAGWDFADPQGWRSLLAALASGADPRMVAALQDGLSRLAGSAIAGELGQVGVLQRDMEYLLRLDALGGMRGGVLTPPQSANSVIQGRIDCLWQDEQGGWQMLLFVWRVGATDWDRAWNEELPRLVLAAAALQQQTGAWPRGVGLVVLPAAVLLRRAGRHLPHRRILGEVTAALAEQAREGRLPQARKPKP